jgi:general secretion pathway protein A
MYESHWGLRSTFYHDRLDARFFHESPTHEEALARLHFLVDQRRRLGLLMGPSGVGKSLLLEVFAGEIRNAGHAAARLSLLGIDAHEFLWILAAELGLNPDRSAGMFRLCRSVADRIIENRYQQLDTVVLLDDADQAEAEVLAQVTRLVQSDLTPQARLTVALACRGDRPGWLGQQLLELVDLRIDVEPWEEPDTAAYLTRALALLGRTAPAFEDAAVARLHELAAGVPRRVNQLADLALLAGAGQKLARVDVHTVEAVCQELSAVNAESMA